MSNGKNFQLNIRKFDISKIRSDATIVAIAQRRSGKSFLMRDILYHQRDIPIGVVMSGTEEASPFFGDFMPKLFIHDNYDSSIISNLVKRQTKIIEKSKEEKARYGHTNINPNAFVILDDLMFDTSWVNDIEVKKLFMNGRHYKILYALTMQSPLGISPSLRDNIDYVFLLRCSKLSTRKKLYEHYAGMFPSFDAFCQVFDSCTENFECLVIDNTTRSNKIEDMVFWYKAKEPPAFKIGAPAFWQYAAANYDGSNEDGASESLDNMNSGGRKNAPNIIINKY